MAKSVEEIMAMGRAERELFFGSIANRYKHLSQTSYSSVSLVNISPSLDYLSVTSLSSTQLTVILESVLDGKSIQELKESNIAAEIIERIKESLGHEPPSECRLLADSRSHRDDCGDGEIYLEIELKNTESEIDRAERFLCLDEKLKKIENDQMVKIRKSAEARRAKYEKLKKEFEVK
jgi:hypothetical protein